MRWSLASMFVATALVAVAAWLGKLAVTSQDVRPLLAVPLLLGVTVGILGGRVTGFIFGVGIGFVLILAVLFWLMIRAGSP
jgi:hypothetical protein